MAKNMYTVAGDGPCNEELALRIQIGDKNAAEQLISQNEGYLTELARAYIPWCEMEDLKQEAALALLDAAGRFDPAYGTKLLTYATPAIEAALSDYAARYSSSLSIPISRYNQLRRVAYLCAEGWDPSDAELAKVVCGELNVSAKVAGALIKEYWTLFCVRQLGDDVFSVSCGGNPAVAYDRLMRRTLLMQRMEEVLTPRELNLVRSYLGIGQPDEVGMTFQELAIRLNYNGPSGEGVQGRTAETEKGLVWRGLRSVALHAESDPCGQNGIRSKFRAVHNAAENVVGGAGAGRAISV